MHASVDVENILRQYSNAMEARTRYPNPLNDDLYSDEFRMYSFKVKKCPLSRAHDWTICPYAHEGERATRRDLHKVPYIAVSCPDYRGSNGKCPRGELCEFAHGVFEYWLHPTKYRTRICNAGTHCTRLVCFFAHSLQQLRDHQPSNPKWARLALRAKTTINNNNNTNTNTNTNTCVATHTSGRHEVGVIGRPSTNKPTSTLRELVSSSSSSTGRFEKRPQEFKLELLESLRVLRISEYYNNNQSTIQQLQNNNNNNNVNRPNVNSDVPSFDWVSDLLAG